MYASIFALLVFSSVLIWIGSLYRDKNSSLDFHLAGRDVGALRLGASTFTLIGGGEFVTLTALSYIYRAWSLIFFGGVALGFLMLALLISRARANAKSADLHSLPDYFGYHFGRRGSVTATVLASISLGALLLIQLVVGGMLISLTTQLPVSACIIGMAIVISIYIYLGGFNGVLATDIVQAFVMFAVIVLLLFAYSISGGASAQAATGYTMPSLGEAAVLFFGGFFAVLGGADVWQRVLSGRDNSSTRKGLLINAIAWLIFGMFIVALALKIQVNHPTADPNNAFFLMLETGLPDWLSAMAALLLFSALVSTADTEMFVLSVMANKEINRARKGVEISTKMTKTYVIAITFVACILALFLQELVDIYFLLLYLMMILGPVALARLLGRGSQVLMLTGILGGVLVLVILITVGRLSGAYPLLIICPPLLAFLGRCTVPLEVGSE